jgi:flagellar biogenesis protein FliO
MENLNILELYQTGGMTLLFIGFQVWLVRYFMKQIDQSPLPKGGRGVV